MPAAATATDPASARSGTAVAQAPDPTLRSPVDRLTAVGLVGFSIAVVIAFWVPALFYGLMTDELLSAWVSSDGLRHAVDRAQRFQGNSPVYFSALWAWRSAMGSSELVLRLPSLLCLVAAAWQLSRLGTEIDHGRRLTGLVAAFFLIAHTEVTLAATTARPYALLLLSVVVSTRAVVHFLHSGSRRAGVLWVLAAAISLSMSPFAALALAAHLVAIVGSARGHRIVPSTSTSLPVEASVWRRRLPGLAVLGAVATAPMAPQVLALARRRGEIVTAGIPDVPDLVEVLLPVSLVVVVGVGIAGGGWRDDSPAGAGRRSLGTAADPALRVAAAWAFGTIALSWALSHLTGTSIWVERYRIAAVPGLGLFIGLVIGRMSRRSARSLAAALLVALSLWSASEMSGLNRHGWREAVDWARAKTADEQVVIALDSDLVELRDLDLLDDPAWRGYLSGPVEYYGLPGDIVLLPTGSAPQNLAHQQRLIDALVSGDDTVVVISTVLFRGPPDHLGDFRVAMRAAGWSETAGPRVGQHQAVVFRR